MATNLEGAQERQWFQYQDLGTPGELKTKVDKLERDNATYRQSIDNLDKQKKELEAKLPEGAVVLAGDDAKRYKEVVDVVPLDKLKPTVEDGVKAIGELAGIRREQGFSLSAAALGMGAAAAKMMMRLLPKDASPEVRTAKDGDLEIKTPYLKLADGSEHKLGDFLSKELSEDEYALLKASKGDSSGNGDGGGGGDRGRNRPPVPPTPSDGARTGDKTGSSVDSAISSLGERAKASNSLLPNRGKSS